MKLSLLLIPVLALMSCGQIMSKKNNQSISVNGASVAGCKAVSVQNASSGSPQFNSLSSYSICAGANSSSVSVRGSNYTSYGSYSICAYPVSGGSVSLQAQCFYPDPSGINSVTFSSTSFNAVLLVEQSDRSSYESAMGYGGTGISVPYASATFR